MKQMFFVLDLHQEEGVGSDWGHLCTMRVALPLRPGRGVPEDQERNGVWPSGTLD